jgi:NTE family protein
MSPPGSASVDLLLSSGFLAFGRQCGFLMAVEELGLEVDGVFGTSSGALAGALWAAGLPAKDALAELSREAPIRRVGLHGRPWRGLFSMAPVIAHLRGVLPATFDALPRPFGVGVRGPDGAHRWVRDGDLPAAVAASCAMPGVFCPVDLEPGPCQDGGAVDRLGLAGHRAIRGERPAIVHLVDRTAGQDGDAPLDGLPVVRSPRSGAQLWNLGDPWGQAEETRMLALAALRR